MNTPEIEPRCDRELATSRRVPHPQARVFAAFGDPEQLATWWGPHGFTNRFDEFVFEPGGAWVFTMRGPDGREFPNRSEFVELRAPSRVVIRHLSEPRFTAEFDLEAVDGGTRVVFRHVFETAELCARVAKFAGDANDQNLDRLAALLDGRPAVGP